MKTYDPIELEIFKNAFVSISEEMGAVLGRTALSPNIKERKDYSCAVFNRRGETLAQGSHIPVHLGAMPLSVRAAVRALAFEPGDVVILNDPYHGGTHLPDITCIEPVFVGKKLSFFAANRAHHSDVGGMTPGSMPLATEIFQEGMILPPLKLIRRGSLDEDVLRLILANVRTPEERRGDLLAQLAACEKGRQRILESVEKYGLGKVLGYSSLIQDYTEKFLRKTLKDIPDGIYAFEDYLDDDGISDDPVRIRVAVRIRGGKAVVDFRGSSPQVKGGVNANDAVTCCRPLRLPLADRGRHSIQHGTPEADRDHRPAGPCRQRPAPGCNGGRERRDVAAHRRCPPRSPGQGHPGQDPGGQPGDHEQHRDRRLRPGQRQDVRLL